MVANINLKDIKPVKYLQPGDYKLIVADVAVKNKPAGDILVIQFEIDGFPFTVGRYFLLDDPRQIGRFKQLVIDLSTNNPDKLTSIDIDSEDFDIQKLVGCQVAAYLGWEDDSRARLKIIYFHHTMKSVRF